jgi:hypothetical protein
MADGSLHKISSSVVAVVLLVAHTRFQCRVAGFVCRLDTVFEDRLADYEDC